MSAEALELKLSVEVQRFLSARTWRYGMYHDTGVAVKYIVMLWARSFLILVSTWVCAPIRYHIFYCKRDSVGSVRSALWKSILLCCPKSQHTELCGAAPATTVLKQRRRNNVSATCRLFSTILLWIITPVAWCILRVLRCCCTTIYTVEIKK